MPGLDKPSEIAIRNAKLPESYARAKAALSECCRIDKCQDWADKALALASYARQARDDSLYKIAGRIRGRATRRVGELLEEFDGRGRPPKKSTGASTFSKPMKRRAADEVGISKRQMDTATRIARIPDRLARWQPSSGRFGNDNASGEVEPLEHPEASSSNRREQAVFSSTAGPWQSSRPGLFGVTR